MDKGKNNYVTTKPLSTDRSVRTSYPTRTANEIWNF